MKNTMITSLNAPTHTGGSQTKLTSTVKLNEIVEVIQGKNLTPRLKATREQLKRQQAIEKQISLHCKPFTTRREATHYFKMVSGLISKDKVDLHEAIFNIQPLPTVSIVNEIKGEFTAVFDPKVKTVVNVSSDKDKLNEYCEDTKLIDFIRSEIFDSYFDSYGDFLIVDIDENNNPFSYIVNSSQIKNYSLDKQTNELKWIIYERGKNYVFLDDKRFIVLDKTNKELISDNEHKAGCTLGFKLWLGESPLMPEAGNLDYLLYKINDMRKMDNQNSAPLTFEVKSLCMYKKVVSREDSKHEIHSCVDGRISIKTNQSVTPTNTPCPKCSNDIRGAGTHLIYSPPREGDQKVDTPFGYIFPKVENLKYTDERNMRLEEDLIKRVAGGQIKMVVNGQAFNEKQVSAMIETKRSLLTRFGKAIARIEQNIMTLYHAVLFSSKANISVDYGNEYFNVTEQQAYELYIFSVTDEAPFNMRKKLHNQWIDTKNRNNTKGYLRDKMISEICPKYHEKKDTVLALKEKGLINEDDCFLHFNFEKLLNEYERETKQKIENGEYKVYEDYINNIYKELLKLIKHETNTPNFAGAEGDSMVHGAATS